MTQCKPKIIELHWSSFSCIQLALGGTFGESFIDQRATGHDIRFKFTGKERDSETGFDYFGARYYSSGLSVRLSVDPLADKYPSTSPFMYVRGNPVMLIDPNGLWDKGADGKWTATKGDSLWSLHKEAVMSWKETMAYAKKYNTARGQDNWKHVGVGDKVTIPGSEEESPSTTNFSTTSLSTTSLSTSSTASNGGGDNSLYMMGAGLNAAGFVSSAGEYSNVINGSWKGLNGKWNSLEWGGNQWTGARANALSKASYFKLASRGFFYAGVLVSGYQGFSAYQTGDYGGVAKSGLDIGMGAFATFGGPPGWIIGGGYFALDALGVFDRPMITAPYTPPMFAVSDNTYVAPPVIFPLR